LEHDAVEAHKDRIESWLTKKRPLRLTKVHTLLARDGHPENDGPHDSQTEREQAHVAAERSWEKEDRGDRS